MNNSMDNTSHDLLHTPVMVDEVLEYLQPRMGQIILDCTVGCGGHASKILDKIKPNGSLLGIDKDEEILHMAKHSLSKTGGFFKLYHADYSDVDIVLQQAGIDKVNGVLLDLGVSSFQLDKAERGFSMLQNGPLDMRMNRSQENNAQYLIRKLPEEKLRELFWKYGEERWAKRISKAIVRERAKTDITTTKQLATIVEQATPKVKSRIHPATRVFQALRIVVNRELESLQIFLSKIHNYMIVGARIVIISFHSLEDRIVKTAFNTKAKEGIFRILTKKPVQPSTTEIERNTRSRSAKLRSAERL
jgi:16S rRNA (cytosine1402-N4)-methyltransferase